MSKIQQELINLRQKEVGVLKLQLKQVQQELQKARVDLAFGRLPKSSTIPELRLRVARLQTVLRSKEIAHA